MPYFLGISTGTSPASIVDIEDKCRISWRVPVNKRVHILIFTFFIGLVGLTPAQSPTSTPAYSSMTTVRPLTLVLLDGFTFVHLREWMERDREWAAFVEESELGFMTMRTASGRSVQNQLLTFATGSKQAGPAILLEAMPLPNSRAMYIPAYAEWFASTDSRIGKTLGERLRDAGIRTAIVGNSDVELTPRRLGPLLLADRDGVTRYVALEEADDYAVLQRAITSNMSADLLVIELGHLRKRAEQVRQTFEAAPIFTNHAEEAQLIELLLWIVQQSNREREVWLLSPGIDVQAEQRLEWMTPLLRYRATERGGGILQSPTTRQDGIVANVDLFPSLLAHFGIRIPIGIEGRVLTHTVLHGGQSKLLNRMDKIFFIHRTRADLLYQVITTQVLILVGVGLLSLRALGRRLLLRAVGHYLLLYVLMVPFWLLVLGAFAPQWDLLYIHLYLVLGGFGTAYMLRKSSRRSLYLRIGVLYVVLLLLDGVLDNTMMKRSFLGYDPVIGARFYGIGNEYMGVLIGSALLVCYLLHERLQRWNVRLRVGVLSLFLLVILAYLALPGGGTNAGGTIAWIVAVVLVSRTLLPNVWRRKHSMWLVLTVGVLFAVFLGIQYVQSDTAQTHIGRLLHHIVDGGTDTLLDTVKRKWEMNVRLMKVSTWSKLFVTSLLVLVWFLFLSRRRHKKSAPDVWNTALRTIVWVSFVHLLVNDSGVVAAALSLLFAAVPLLHLVLEERTTPPPTPS